MSIKKCSKCLLNAICIDPCSVFIPPAGRKIIYFLKGNRLNRLQNYHIKTGSFGRYELNNTEIFTISSNGWTSIKDNNSKFTTWFKITKSTAFNW